MRTSYLQCILISLLQLVLVCQLVAQENPDSLKVDSTLLISHKSNDYSFGPKKLILPGLGVLYGLASLKIDALKDLNTSTSDEIKEDKPQHTVWDNFSQYGPALFVYGLNLAGVEGKHDFADRTIIYLTSQMIMASIVYPVKHLVREQRPDGSNWESFPSGHTATAFSSAQFLFREYRDKNIWLSLSGYPLAIFTGVYRVVNNRHWIGDVAAGAGIGIFSTEFAYWLYPKINKILGRRDPNSGVAFTPFYQQGNIGLGFAKTF